ncbi:GGDEF domain-containing protein [Sporosarcina sp. P21c]|uniref:sensor domain-containing diguanylate cyclase n=1 Tax=Sporosarcina TaxID=1569 RepID=UPI000A163594|nr:MULTISPECIES: sensor domain-containing diguanylate cyclase [Sporosarcina]ARJ38867.1 diguanylate cyclase [Sporosarcina ureae]PIC68294.1 GGDEF domain-containing protein [Sporosarcina sp. P16a]PIC84119.1 GGDEF domain-containing protein [Sporosarcina sp. P1]PIC90505.1 GGDEF domain-containing protein [Sporosarcina sp. P21c]PIC94036.1 GGDEF domain-containing protein [Sporosarcina sp. P25]
MRWSLKNLIQVVALLAIVLTFLTSTTIGYRVNKQAIIDSTLETNYAYAEKLSSTTDIYLRETLKILEANTDEILPFIDQENAQAQLGNIAERVRSQTSTFNSVVISSAEGIVLGVSPPNLEVLGEKLTSVGAQQAVRERKPMISQPYIGLTGELIIFISVPIIKEDEYKGFIGGAIYLNKPNILETLLGEHFYKNDSYVYVVDAQGRLIYHQEDGRLKDDVSSNIVVQTVVTGESGYKELINTKGVPMLAGYAYVPIAKWGIVAQRQLDVSVAPAKEMVLEMALKSLPLLLLSFFLVRYLSRKIALPLQRLAYYTENSTESDQKVKMVGISDWYYEAKQLKGAMLHSLDYFKNEMNYFIHQSTTDPLTKLTNRRMMDSYMKQWVDEGTPFALIIFDIDKFKRVNDRYGHAVGDKVLIYLADLMLRTVREQDVCCRYGGEEFVILLPKSDKVTAYLTAERLREKLEDTVSPCGEVITISAGVAAYPLHANHPARLTELADQSLYEAKRTGRNKTIVVSDEPRHE